MSKAKFINRELSWLDFNYRVLEESFDKNNLIMERFKFLGITSSNLDEFFMVRVAGLKDQISAGYHEKDSSGLRPSEQLAKIEEKAHEFSRKQYSCLNKSLLPGLKEENILFPAIEELTNKQLEFIEDYFDEYCLPVLTPLAVDKSRPFPLLKNTSLNLLVEMLDENEKHLYAVVQVPTVLDRILKLPKHEDTDQLAYIFLEEILIQHIHKLFIGYNVKATAPFRITLNADLAIDEDEAEDLLIEIEKSLQKRKWGSAVRLEIDKRMKKKMKKFLISRTEISDDDLYEVTGPLDLKAWMTFSFSPEFSHLRDKKFTPQTPESLLGCKDIFKCIREQDRFLHHPYESFDCVVDFIKKAANDPNVLAIKQTLYRVSGDSPIIDALIQAASNGKQVTVLVELKARFDEENNIVWARKLDRAGCHVIYGLPGLKIHCKLVLIVRKESDGIRRYVHLGTGNYNDSTAKLYTDMGMFTSKEPYAADVSALFNVLSGYSKAPFWQKLAVAPTGLRSHFYEAIDREIDHAQNGQPAKIIAKMNSLIDTGMTKKLYEASKAGVEIILIVRGICGLVPGIDGLSENITVRSIVGRFLEHSRIYYFYNGGVEDLFLGSADWMSRNLNRRIEVLFPIEDDAIKRSIYDALMVMLSDNVKARMMNSDGTYSRIDKRGKELINSQNYFCDQAIERANQSILSPLEHY